MKKLLAAALAGLFFAQPAAAATVLGDFDVYAAGSVYIAGGSYGDIGAGSFTNANGAGGTNFTSKQASTPTLTAKATSLSDGYAALTPTGTVTASNGVGTLTGTGSGIDVFDVTVAQLASFYKLTFTGTGTGAIVNVLGTGSLTNYINYDFGSLSDPTQILFNFVDATTVRMDGPQFKGSILAPDALVQLQGGSVQGSVVSKSFYSEGTTIGGNAFNGFSAAPTATAAVPEPATWITLILGFAAIGGAMRRRPARARLSIA